MNIFETPALAVLTVGAGDIFDRSKEDQLPIDPIGIVDAYPLIET